MKIPDCTLEERQPATSCNARDWVKGEWVYCATPTEGTRCGNHDGHEGVEAKKEKQQAFLNEHDKVMAERLQARYEELKQTPGSANDLDDEIIGLGAMIDVLEEHPALNCELIRRAKETKAKLIEIRTRTGIMVRDAVTTDLIWNTLTDILEKRLSDVEIRKQVLRDLAVWLDGLLRARVKGA